MISPLALTIPLLKQLKFKARCLVTPLPRRGINKELIFFLKLVPSLEPRSLRTIICVFFNDWKQSQTSSGIASRFVPFLQVMTMFYLCHVVFLPLCKNCDIVLSVCPTIPGTVILCIIVY